MARSASTKKRPANELDDTSTAQTPLTVPKKSKTVKGGKANASVVSATVPPSLQPSSAASEVNLPSPQDSSKPAVPLKPAARKAAKVTKAVPSAHATQQTAPELPTIPQQPNPNVKGRPPRSRKPSEVAQNVAKQEAKAQNTKNIKAQRKAKKVQDTIIEETPEATKAFLEEQERNAQSVSKGEPVSTKTSKRAEQEGLIAKRLAQKSLSRARSVSNIASSRSDTPVPDPLDNTARSSSPIPSFSIRGWSPPLSPSTPEDSLAPGLDTDLPGAPGVNVMKALRGLCKELAPPIVAPEPLDGPLHPPRRLTPLPSAPQHGNPSKSNLKRSKKESDPTLLLQDLVSEDKSVVSDVLDRFKSLIVTHDPFPVDSNWQILAQRANADMCRGISNRLECKPGSEYEHLILNRTSNVRNVVVGPAAAEIASQYGFGVLCGNESPEERQTILDDNVALATKLLQEANFTCPSFKQLDALYEHPIFMRVLQKSFFSTQQDGGPKHCDLWECITVPCLALLATVVEKTLMEYISGGGERHKSITFSSKIFRPKYLTHVATLCTMYEVESSRLKNYCVRLAKELHRPWNSYRSSLTSVQPRLSLASIAARYGRSGARAGPSISTPVTSRVVSAPSRTPLRHPPLNSAITQAISTAIKAALADQSESDDGNSPPNWDDFLDSPTSGGLNALGALLKNVTTSSDSETMARRAGAIPAATALSEGEQSKDSDDDDGAEAENMDEEAEGGEGEAEEVLDEGEEVVCEEEEIEGEEEESEEVPAEDEESDGEGDSGKGSGDVEGSGVDVAMEDVADPDEDNEEDEE